MYLTICGGRLPCNLQDNNIACKQSVCYIRIKVTVYTSLLYRTLPPHVPIEEW